MLFTPGIETLGHFISHVITPVADFSISNKLRRWIRKQLLQINRFVRPHFVECKVIAQGLQTGCIKETLNTEESDTSTNHTRQILDHVLVLDEQHILILAPFPKGQHVLPIGSHWRESLQKEIYKLLKVPINSVQQLAVVVVRNAEILWISSCVNDPWLHRLKLLG